MTKYQELENIAPILYNRTARLLVPHLFAPRCSVILN